MRRGSRGFSLIEILAVTFILALTSGIIAILLSSVLRAGNKAKIAAEVTRNGNYILSVISNHLRNSEGLLYVGGNTNITNCFTTQTVSSVTVRGFDGADTTFACDTSTLPYTIASQSGSLSYSLLDTSEVELDTAAVPCTTMFTCTQQGTTPTITIQFQLKNKGTANLVEDRYSALFKTDVFLRNAVR